MTKIIVAGAGHGGLIAAARLAKAGFEVEILERKQKEELGYDWEDRFTFDVLLDATENTVLPDGSWRYRGDCEFVSPSKRTEVKIKYNDETRQKVMWRKPLIEMLVAYAEKNGVVFRFGTEIIAPIIKAERVVGIKTSEGERYCDLVIDAAGVSSALRTNLPDSFGIEKEVRRGDVFYAYRAYFDLKYNEKREFPFEVYLYHEREQGLSWFLTNDEDADILIGRIDPLTDKKVAEQLSLFRKNHPWCGENVLHGGNYGIIPVRRPLAVMVADGYAAVGDSAFMTTPMNGMGIDLSLNAGLILAKTVIEDETKEYKKETLWNYNRDFHKLFGGDTAKNEGLKNALLSLPPEGVDFLFDNAVIQSADLAGAGRNTNLKALLGKFVRGMKNPKYFFAIIKGLIKGAKASKTYKRAPEKFDRKKIELWQNKIKSYSIKIDG